MGNIGSSEILVVLLIALLVLGPTRLPGAARQMGKAMAEFRKVTTGLQNEMRGAISELESDVSFDDSPPTFPVGVDPAAAPGSEALPPAAPPAAETAWSFPDMTPAAAAPPDPEAPGPQAPSSEIPSPEHES